MQRNLHMTDEELDIRSSLHAIERSISALKLEQQRLIARLNERYPVKVCRVGKLYDPRRRMPKES
jgi:hypothetical protein